MPNPRRQDRELDALYDAEEHFPDNVIELTTAMVRKLARLTALHASTAVVKIAQDEDHEDCVHVEWLDEYGSPVRDHRPGHNGRKDGHLAVIREDGWSNPSVKRMRNA